jgi:hypothetical protein
MIRAIIGELPAWARRDHPVLRYELSKAPRPRLRGRLLRAFVVVVTGLILIGAGVIIATGMFTRAPGANVVESIHAIAYFPLILVQLAARIAAFLTTADVVGEELRRQTWDHVRATEHGAETALRARWFAVFYRLRGLLGVVLLTRALLLGLLLYDVTAFQGRYLDLLTFGITPEIALPVAVILVALLLTAALVLPFTGIAFDAALGLLVSAHVQQRAFNSLAQFLGVLLRAAITAGLLLAAYSYLQGTLSLSDPLGWLLLLAFGGAGDWGGAYLLLSRFGEVWAAVPFGVFLGAGLIGFALAQAWLADRALHLAARRSQQE